MEDRSPQGLRSSYAQSSLKGASPLSSKRTSAPRTDDELAALLAGDRVFAAAQVTLFVKLMLTVLVLDAQAQDTYTLPKSVAAHATSLLLGALLLWLLARYGRRLLFWSPIHVAAGALLAAFALASVFALDLTIALFGTSRRYLGLTQMLDNVVLYFAAAVLLRDARSLRLVTFVTLGTAIPVTLYTAVQKLGLDPLKFKESPNPLIATFGNPDLLGSYLAMVAITAFAIAFLQGGRLSRLVLAGLVALGLLCTAMLFMTGVRAGVLALGAGFAAMVLLALVLPWRKGWWLKGTLGFAALLAIAVIVSPIGGRLRFDTLRNDSSTAARLEIWDVAEKAVVARPLLGVGPDNFAVFYPANRSQLLTEYGLLENSTHSLWLYVATSAGLVGLVALFAFVAVVVQQALRGAQLGQSGALALVPFFAYLGQAFVGINELVIDWVFWLSAGVVAGAGAQAFVRPRTGYAQPKRARLIGAIAIAAATLAIITLVLPRIGSQEALSRAEEYSAATPGAQAIAYGQDAVRGDPRRGETWSTYGTALTTAGRLPAAVAAYTAAAEREPWLPIGWTNLAIVWAQLGNRGAARASADRAVVADRYDGEAWDLIATLAYDAGDYARAAPAGERAVAFRSPPLASTYFTAASAYVRLKDLARAEAIATAGVGAYPTASLRLLLAAILADEGKRAEALTVVDRVLAEQPGNIDAQTLKRALTAQQ